MTGHRSLCEALLPAQPGPHACGQAPLLGPTAGHLHAGEGQAGKREAAAAAPAPKAWCHLPDRPLRLPWPVSGRNKSGFGTAEAGRQHLPAPRAAALPCPPRAHRQRAVPAGEPQLGSAGRRPRETETETIPTPTPPPALTHALRNGARPGRARRRWVPPAATGGAGRRRGGRWEV